MSRLPLPWVGEGARPERVGPATLAFAAMASPIVFMLAFLLNVIFVRPRCDAVAIAMRVLVPLLALVVVLLSAHAAWHVWRGAGAHDDGGTPEPAGRNRFLGWSGMLLAAVTVPLLLLMFVVVLVLDPCFSL